MAIDPTKARVERELKHTSPLMGCRFDPSGCFLFATAQDFTIQRWELGTGKAVSFAGHTSWVRGLAWDKATKTLADVAVTDGKSLIVSGIKRKNRAVETLEAKQLEEHIGKRAQRGKLADVGFRADRLSE